MRVDFNGIVKSTKGLAKNAAVFVSKNKHALIEGGLAGALAVIKKREWIEGMCEGLE